MKRKLPYLVLEILGFYAFNIKLFMDRCPSDAKNEVVCIRTNLLFINIQSL